MSTPDLDLEVAVKAAASNVLRRFGDYVERDDLVQEGWLWVLEHPGTLASYNADEIRRDAQYRLDRDLRMAMERCARAERAHMLGYRPEDEHFYDRGFLIAVLPAVFDRAEAPPEFLREIGSRAGREPSEEYGNWIVIRQDVENAFYSLNHADRKVMHMRYDLGMSQQEVGMHFGVAQDAISHREKRIFARMVRHLGGRRPYVAPDVVSSSGG